MEDFKRKNVEEMKNMTRKFETKEKISWNRTEHLPWDGRHWCLSKACPSYCWVESQRLTPNQHTITVHYSSFVLRHPFLDEKMEVPHLPNWRNPVFKMYDGTTNSDEHLEFYTIQVSLFILDDAIIRRVFSTSLKDISLSWFTQLSPFSVDSC